MFTSRDGIEKGCGMGHTILIVDDEGIVAEDLSSCVTGLGYDVVGVTASGEDAVAQAGVHRPDVVLMDIMLQGEMDGIRAAELIRQHFGTPVIFVTAYADDSTLQRAKITEPYAYILKPFEERELHSAIEIAIYKSSVERQLKEKEHELEYRVLERTYELETTNEEMQAEIRERIRVEHELEESNLFLRSILDSSSSISIIVTDKEGLITFWNIGAQKLFGYKAAEVVGRSNISILYPMDEPWTIATLKQMRQNARTTKQFHRREVIECTKSGEKVWINLAVSPRLDENGNCIGILGLGENITARKLAERELFTARGRLEHLLDTSRVVIYSRKVEAVYGMTFISNNVGMLLGCETTDILDEPAFWTSRLHPDDRQRLLTTVALFNDGHQVIEYRFKHGNGMYRWLRDEARLVRDDDRVPLEIVGSCVDITDEKEMEDALRESEEKFRALAEFSQDIIMRYDKCHRLLYVNPMAEKQTGVPVEAFFGKTHAELGFPAEFVAFWESEIERTFQSKSLRRTEYQLPSGVWVDWELIPEFLPNGDVETIVTSARDITEQKQAQQRLRDSLEEKEVMLREIHHRVKNNLQVIIALMGLQAESVTDKKTQDMLAELQARARVMSLVHEILYQSQNIARVNLTSYIKTLAANVMQTIGINFNTVLQVHADDVFVGIDTAIPCGLIINELVTNALKYAFPPALRTAVDTPGACEIHIRICAEGPLISLSVSDNGIGLPEHFDWKRAKSLGLRLVNILSSNQLRGTIDVSRDGGTSFSITFCEPHAKTGSLIHTKSTQP
jgi:PAS domain S-box-containing protein